MALRDQVETLLVDCLQEYARQSRTTLSVGKESRLLGPSAELDSLGLVMVVTDFETRLNQVFGARVVLASEQAMSMSRSPFRSVDALSEYAVDLLRKAGKE